MGKKQNVDELVEEQMDERYGWMNRQQLDNLEYSSPDLMASFFVSIRSIFKCHSYRRDFP
jgi:hypothetical protein